MILAILSALGQQLDLAAIAGLITVIGTGVDQLVIITDRFMPEQQHWTARAKGNTLPAADGCTTKDHGILGIIIG